MSGNSKVCTRCKQVKPESEFWRLQASWCKDCDRASARERARARRAKPGGRNLDLATSRAKTRLTRKYHEDYQRLLIEELDKLETSSAE